MRPFLDLRPSSLLIPLLLLASCSGSSSSSPLADDDTGGGGGRSGEGTGGSSGGAPTDRDLDEEGSGGTGARATGGGAQDGLGGAAGAADTGGRPGADLGEQTPQPEGGCRTALEANGSAQTLEVCRPADGVAQHVRLENVDAGSGHTSVQLFLGFGEPPTSTQGALAADQFKVMLYSGTPNDVHVSFGEASATLSGPHSFTGAPSTLCFDLTDGAVDRAPRLVLWVDGVNGASCSDFTTLTEVTAYGSEEHWGGAVGAIAKDQGAYLYQAASIDADPAVALWPRPASSCVVEWEENSEWQRLCEPLGGATHFRLEDLHATANSRYFYLVFGEDEAPSGTPASAAGDGKLIVSGGQNHQGASWTWFRFDGESTEQFAYSNTAGALYTAAPTTVCAELHSVDEGARMAYWATGSGDADCTDPSTLGADNALILQEWDTLPAADKSNYVKTSNSGITLSRVIVSNTGRARPGDDRP